MLLDPGDVVQFRTSDGFRLHWSPPKSFLYSNKGDDSGGISSCSFGPNWLGKVVQFVVDNEAVVSILNSTSSKDTHLMHLVRLLVFFAAKFDFWFTATHIPGSGKCHLQESPSSEQSLLRHTTPPRFPQQ